MEKHYDLQIQCMRHAAVESQKLWFSLSQSLFRPFRCSSFIKTPITWILAFAVIVNSNQDVIDTQLGLKVNKVWHTSAELEVRGLRSSLNNCDLTYCQIGKTELQKSKLIVTHKIVTLHELTANQTYTASITCTNNNTGHEESSPLLNFTTAVAKQSKASLSSTASLKPTTTVSFSSTRKKTIIYNTVTVYQDSAPLDIALGLIFGVIGLAVIGIAVYHLVKKQRRRLRRRRLLNRNQENDVFPDPDDYGAAL